MSDDAIPDSAPGHAPHPTLFATTRSAAISITSLLGDRDGNDLAGQVVVAIGGVQAGQRVATEVAALFGDETELYAQTRDEDLGGVALAVFVARHLGRGKSGFHRIGMVGKFLATAGLVELVKTAVS